MFIKKEKLFKNRSSHFRWRRFTLIFNVCLCLCAYDYKFLQTVDWFRIIFCQIKWMMKRHKNGEGINKIIFSGASGCCCLCQDSLADQSDSFLELSAVHVFCVAAPYPKYCGGVNFYAPVNEKEKGERWNPVMSNEASECCIFHHTFSLSLWPLISDCQRMKDYSP